MNTSIIIVCWDWAKFLDGAILNAKEQTKKAEIIVLTDGKSEEVKRIAQFHKVKLIESQRKNNVARLNEAVEVAKAFYIIQCVDDFLKPSYVKKVENIFIKNPQIEIVYPDLEQFGDAQGRLEASFGEHTLENNSLFVSSAVRKSLWLRLGGYDEEIPYSQLEDWDFWVRAYRANTKSYHLQEPLFCYRRHAEQMSNTLGYHAQEITSYLRSKWNA